MKTAQEIMDLLEAVVDLNDNEIIELFQAFTYDAVERKIIALQSRVDDLDLLKLYNKLIDTL